MDPILFHVSLDHMRLADLKRNYIEAGQNISHENWRGKINSRQNIGNEIRRRGWNLHSVMSDSFPMNEAVQYGNQRANIKGWHNVARC